VNFPYLCDVRREVPAHPLLPHPDGIDTTSEVEVGELFSAPEHELILLGHQVHPDPGDVNTVYDKDENYMSTEFIVTIMVMRSEDLKIIKLYALTVNRKKFCWRE
jgi:hypothetical protein